MRNGRCKKKFPRNLTQKTDTSIDGYPHYRRRTLIKKDGILEMPYKEKVIANKGKYKIDNQWLPGYNAPLIMKNRLHINVECCQGMSSVAYILNYIHKGHDVAYVEFKQYAKEVKNDEIKMYKYGRVMTADEAHWDISSFPISEIKPTCKIMSFFEPDKKRFSCPQGEEAPVEKSEQLLKQTEFFQFFERNKLEKEIYEKYLKMKEEKKNPEVIAKKINDALEYEMFYVENNELKQFFDYERQETKKQKEERERENKPQPLLPWSFELVYPEFGKRYVFKKGKLKTWKRYKKLENPSTRLPLRFPGNEYFYLRILLKHRKGMTSDLDLYNDPDGVRQNTFKMACLKHGYIKDSEEYFTAMYEAHQLGSFGLKLLYFFAAIISEGDATNIKEIWDGVGLENKKTLTEEEQLCPNGFKDHMIVVPKELLKKGHSKDWRQLPNNLKPLAEQYTLRKLAFYLEENGKEYPPELPPLTESNKFLLHAEWLHAHEMESDEATRIFNANIASTLIFFCSIFWFSGMRGNNKIGKDNPDQLNFVEEVTKELQDKREKGKSYNGKCYMLDGPGGNGKTFCLDTIYAYCNMEENEFLCLCSAFSGNF